MGGSSGPLVLSGSYLEGGGGIPLYLSGVPLVLSGRPLVKSWCPGGGGGSKLWTGLGSLPPHCYFKLPMLLIRF